MRILTAEYVATESLCVKQYQIKAQSLATTCFREEMQGSAVSPFNEVPASQNVSIYMS